MCYAYREFKNASWVEELYEDHVRGIWKCFDERWEFKGLIVKASRLLGISESEVEGYIKLAAILHDIGKLRRKEQEDCRSAGCVSFRHHYALSARVVHSLARSLDLDIDLNRFTEDISKNDKVGDKVAYFALVFVPVLLHHYAQITFVDDLREAINYASDQINMYEDCVSVCEKLLKDLKDELESKGVTNTKAIMRIVEEALKTVKNSKFKLRGIIDSDKLIELLQSPEEKSEVLRVRFIAEAVLGLLNMCDGIVAKEHRGKRTLF